MRIFSLNGVAISCPLAARTRAALADLPGAGLKPGATYESRTPLDLRDDFLAHRRRRRLVAIEMHRVRPAALRARPQIGRVAEHLGERHARVDHLRSTARFHRLDMPAPARD